ncbi:PmoA family protein [Verrucomicrobiales bacterium]|nr:PmoA family protein [Verrucomicrobiales bacterium]MDA7926692.1 PmoA family protein [Verrucomicrobiales bacterium]
MNRFTILVALSFGVSLLASTASAEYVWEKEDGKHLDLRYKTRLIARYMFEPIDESSKERREETYKPFCHIYKWWSKDHFVTKGAGGKFPHHRGIFYGFSRISYTDNEGKDHSKVDTWHCRMAHQVHREFTEMETDEESGTFTSKIDWIGDDGNAFATELRTMRFSVLNSDVVVDFNSTLTPLVPRLKLDGDPQHAGFQFRASNEVSELGTKSTYYLRPVSGKGKPGSSINWSAKTDTEATRDLAWKGMCFTVEKKQYTVAYLDSPSNPKPARYSERDYGRFGSYFSAEVSKEKPLEVHYRLVIREGEMEPDEIAALSDAFTKE